MAVDCRGFYGSRMKPQRLGAGSAARVVVDASRAVNLKSSPSCPKP